MAGASAANLRKLAAIDVVFLGPKFVIAEYACGTLLPLALGMFILLRARSVWQVVLGVYFLCLGINYAPMLVYAIGLGDREKARAGIANELAEQRKAMSKYRRLSLVLLVPFAALILALRNKGRAVVRD